MTRPTRGLLHLLRLTLIAGTLGLTSSIAQAADLWVRWAPGPGVGGQHAEIVGLVEEPQSGVHLILSSGLMVRGWVVDRYSAARPYIWRQDVANLLGSSAFRASGFEARIPAGALGPGPHTLLVYAHFPFEIGWWWTSVELTVLAATPIPEPSPAGPLAAPTNRLLGIACASATAPEGRPGVEITVASTRPFPVRNQLVVLEIGSVTSLVSHDPDNGDLHTLIFSLTAEEWARVMPGDPVVVRYGLDKAAAPEDTWIFGPFDPTLAPSCAPAASGGTLAAFPRTGEAEDGKGRRNDQAGRAGTPRRHREPCLNSGELAGGRDISRLR